MWVGKGVGGLGGFGNPVGCVACVCAEEATECKTKKPWEEADVPENTRWCATAQKIHFVTKSDVPLCLHKQGPRRAKPLKRVFAEHEAFSAAVATGIPICMNCKQVKFNQLAK